MVAAYYDRRQLVMPEGGWGRLGVAGGGQGRQGRPEASCHVQRGPVMLRGGRRLLVMPGFGSQYLEAAGGGL